LNPADCLIGAIALSIGVWSGVQAVRELPAESSDWLQRWALSRAGPKQARRLLLVVSALFTLIAVAIAFQWRPWFAKSQPASEPFAIPVEPVP
jgi:hypothetical protein